MAAELVIAPEAEHDLANAYDWYETQRVGLGEEFLGSVDAAMQGIQRRPLLHAMVHEEFRRKLVRRFPYAIFYDVLDDCVTVYCVCHTSRDPEKWRQRLK